MRSFPSLTASASARRWSAKTGRQQGRERSWKRCCARFYPCRERKPAGRQPQREEKEMPRLETLPATAAPEDVVAILKRDGALIVTGVLSPADLSRVLSETKPYIDATENGRDDFTGHLTTRTGALVARSPACRKLVMNRMVTEAANLFLKPFCERIQLHLTQIIRIKPGQPKQSIHRDRWAWGVHLKSVEPQFNTIWAITDVTKGNGATQGRPGI